MNHTDKLIEKPELALQQAEAFLSFVDAWPAIEAQYKAAEAAWGAIKEAMLAHNVNEIELNDNRGVIKLANGNKVWSVDGKIADRFYKTVLDTTKLNNLLKANEKLPKHVSYETPKKLLKGLK